jgi:hypothetical protein
MEIGMKFIPKNTQRGYVKFGGKNRGKRSGAAGGGGGGGGGEFSTNFRGQVNLAGITDYGGILAFINIVKNSSRGWSDGAELAANDARLNSNYEPANLGAGNSIQRLQWILDNLTPGATLKTGTHVIKWTGAGDFHTVAGVTSTLVSPNRRTFTVTSGTTFLLTEATGPCTNLRICHIDHEAAMDAGEILHPDFVTWLQSWPNIKAFRFLDFLNTNFSTVTNAADWTPLTHISWVRGEVGCPPEVIAEVAKKTNDSPVWLPMPYLATNAAMVACYQRMRDWYNGTYTVLSEGINEHWNTGFLGAQWLRFVYGFTIQNKDVNGNNADNSDENRRWNSGYGHHTLRTWAAADSVFGTSRVRLIAGGQTDFPGLTYYWSNYSDPAYYGGATIKSLMNVRGHLILSHYFSIQQTHKQTCIDNWGAKTDDEWVNAWKAYMNVHRDNLYPTAISLQRGLGNNAPYLIYEGGCHDFIDAHSPLPGGWAEFYGTVNTATNTIDMGATNYAGFSNFDQVAAINQIIGGGLDTYGNYAYVRKISANRMRLYPTLAAATADTGDTGAGAGVMNAGTFYLSNLTRHVACQNKLYSLLQGPRGLEMAQYIETILKIPAINVRNMSLFAGPSQMRLNQVQRFTYSFESPNRGVYSIGNESPYVTYLKGLNTP